MSDLLRQLREDYDALVEGVDVSPVFTEEMRFDLIEQLKERIRQVREEMQK